MKIAILYQVKEPPAPDGIRKPMKKGGYSDSGADIAVELMKNGYEVAVPVAEPRADVNTDWVFGDDEKGIESAIKAGADVLWLNTVLYSGHPIEKFRGKGIKLVGQRPSDVSVYDDKLYTNELLKAKGLSVVKESKAEFADDYMGEYPCVLKPIRGRGSQGVSVVYDKAQLERDIAALKAAKIYGDKFMIEPYLNGEEITVAVFPPKCKGEKPYALAPVRRFNHIDGIAPYNGVVPVSENSVAEDKDERYSAILADCEKAYELLDLKAPIRIDCRKNKEGKFEIFDVNLKPNMTLASRAGREKQDSLVMIAAAHEGMTRIELVMAYINTAWEL